MSRRRVIPAAGVSLGYLRAFTEIAARLQKAIAASRKAFKPGSLPVRMIVAGGAAQHFYTAERVSMDVDATLSARLLLPEDLDVPFMDADGTPRVLYFDRQYNDSFALLHEDAGDDARPLKLDGIDPALLDVRLLTPLDLAVSKLSRYAEHDQQDIAALARHGLIDAASLKTRAGEALAGFVGDLRRVRTSINLACKLVEGIKAK